MKRKSMKYYFIKRNFLLFGLSFLIPLLAVGILFWHFTCRDTENTVREKLLNSQSLTEDMLENIMVDARAVNTFLEQGNQIILFYQLLNEKNLDYETSISMKYLSAYLVSTMQRRSYIDSVYLYIPNQNQRVVTSDRLLQNVEELADRDWTEAFEGHRLGTSWMRLREIKKNDFEEKYEVCSVFQRFYQYPGGIVVNYRTDYLTQLMDSMAGLDGQQILVTDREGKILMSTSETDWKEADIPEMKAGTARLNGKDYHLLKKEYEPFQADIVTLIPQSAIYEIAWKNAQAILFFLALILIVSLALSYYLALRSYRELYSIIDIFDRAEKKQALPQVRPAEKDLYAYILNNIVRTFVDNSYLKIQLSERKYRLLAAELQALQYQINPHFLFNTLQAINYEILASSGGESTRANQMVEYLSDIMRYSLDADQKSIALSDELENAKKYVEIQAIRHNHCFQVEWYVQAETLETEVPRLVLQPLLENAVRHGVRFCKGKGQIRVVIRKTESGVRFRVADNGAGMSREALEALRRDLEKPAGEFKSRHIGLENTNHRLTLLYGEKASLHILSREKAGTIVWFEIPLK